MAIRFARGLAALCLAATATSASATVALISDYRHSAYTQTIAGLQENNSQISIEFDPAGSDAVTSASFVTPAGTSYAASASPYRYASYVGFPANAAAMSASFADGAYQYTATTANGGTVHFTDTFSSALRPDVIPMIINLAALSTMDTTKAITLQTSVFASEGYQQTGYLLINDQSGHVVYDNNDATVRSGAIAIAANTFTAGTKYNFQLDWGNFDSHYSGSTLLADGYRISTSGSVTFAAAPEPATWATMLIGFAATGFALRRRRNMTFA